MSDPRIEQGMREQLALRRRTLDGGAEPLGWKIGFNVAAVQARLGIDGPLAGFLTTAGLAENGGSWPIRGGEELLAEPEVAVEIGADGRSIAALLPAIELAEPPDLELPLEEILERNIFHRGVAFGPRAEVGAPGAACLEVNGDLREEVAAESAGADLEAMVAAIADRLVEAGERLRPGDRIITGVIAPPPRVGRGDRVRLQLEEVGAVELSLDG